MVDRAELRKMAEAATPGPWAHEADERPHTDMNGHPTGRTYIAGWNINSPSKEVVGCEGIVDVSPNNAAYIAAASPDVVLGLLDEIDAQEQAAVATEEIVHKLGEERDQLREDAKQAIVIVANVGRELGQTQHERDQLRAVAVMLKGALERLDRKLSSLNHGTSSVVRQVVYVALADPEVEKL